MTESIQVDVVIEVPKGSRNKFEWDPSVNAIRLDRELFTATRYPADYGFVVDTLGEDGDALDALVLLGEPTFPGCHIFCRPLGVFWMSDEHGPDAKLLMVPCADSRVEWWDLDDVPESLLLEIAHFFEIYKELEPGKATSVRGWDNRAAAEAEIHRGHQRRTAAGSDLGAGAGGGGAGATEPRGATPVSRRPPRPPRQRAPL